MSDPFGGPFAPWDKDTAYDEGDRVTFGGYIYQLMDGPSTNDDPRSATYTASATNAIGPGSDTRSMRKWRVWDYPVGYYMARLLRLPAFSITGPEEVRTFCVRGDFDDRTGSQTYPTSASYIFYDMPAGTDTVWPDPNDGELMTAPSAVPLEDSTRPKAYGDPSVTATSDAVCFQPNTVSALIRDGMNGVNAENYLLPAWSDETQGQMFACTLSFSRNYTFIDIGSGTDTSATPAFQDNWEATREFTGYDSINYIIGTSPDLSTDA